MFWQIQFFPPCTHHIFLSHCREDREWLVLPLYERLQSLGIVPWLDRHDYPYGRASFEALRDGVLKSRHVVFLVTKAMLAQSRGWSIVELAWAELLQDNLRDAGAVLQNISLPLFFLEQGSEQLLRTVWQSVRDRAAFHLPPEDPIGWASRQIAAFVSREERRALDIVLGFQQDLLTSARLQSRAGLIDRVTAQYPLPNPREELNQE
jgi:hypothetical protein